MTKHASAPKAGKTTRRTSATRGLVLPGTGEFVIPGRESTGKSAAQNTTAKPLVVAVKRVKGGAAALKIKAPEFELFAKLRESSKQSSKQSWERQWDEVLSLLKADRPVSITTGLARGLLDAGLPARLISDLTDMLGVSSNELAYLMDIDRSTVTRLKQNDKPVPMHSAESILRLVEVKQLATEVFGSSETASKWLNKPHPSFDSKPPIGEVRSSYGAQHVKDVLLAIQYGGVV